MIAAKKVTQFKTSWLSAERKTWSCEHPQTSRFFHMHREIEQPNKQKNVD